MQQLAEAAMEREAYAEEVCLFSATGCLTYLIYQQICTPNVSAMQARQAGAVSRLTKVLDTGRALVMQQVPVSAASDATVSSHAACSL